MTSLPADDPLAANDPNPAYEAALGAALELAQDLKVFDLSRAAANPDRSDLVAALMAHELAGCHRLMMRFAAMADDYLSYTSPRQNEEQQSIGRDAIGYAAIAARLMDRYRLAALSLAKLQTVKSGPRKIIVDWGTDDGNPDMNGGGGANDGGGDTPAASGETPPPAAAAAPANRGRLRNGNPSGDFLSSPRCGAHSRAGTCCRQPAMANGRCRLHGGKSTGARTAEGRHKVRTVNLRHGRRTAAVIGLRSAASAVSKRLAWMTRLSREISAGHGVVRSDSVPPLAGPTAIVGAAPRGRPGAAAGHGVVRSESHAPLGRAAVTRRSTPTAAGSSPPAHSRTA